MDDADVSIAASEDCRPEGVVPVKPGSVAAVHYRMLAEEPYRHTQRDALFAASAAVRAGEPADREAFFARPQACLRGSPLVKTHGWGIHLDAQGRAAAYPKGSEATFGSQRTIRCDRRGGCGAGKASRDLEGSRGRTGPKVRL